MNRVLVAIAMAVVLVLIGVSVMANRLRPPLSPEFSTEARLRRLEGEVEILRRQVNPTEQERYFMVPDEKTGACRERNAGDMWRGPQPLSPEDRQIMSGSIPRR